MYYKLAAMNNLSFSICRKIRVIDDLLLQISRLAMTLFSIFYKPCPTEQNHGLTRTQHLQYEVVHLDGDVKMSNSIIMKKEIFKVILDNKSILLDITKLNFIDGSGIAILIESLYRANASGLKFIIVGANNLPLKMLELTKLDNVFNLVNSIHDVKL